MASTPPVSDGRILDTARSWEYTDGMSMAPYPPAPPPSGPVDNPGRLPTVIQTVLMLVLLAVGVFLMQYLSVVIALVATLGIAAAGALVVHLVRNRLVHARYR
jgi:hypothetical protein